MPHPRLRPPMPAFSGLPFLTAALLVALASTASADTFRSFSREPGGAFVPPHADGLRTETPSLEAHTLAPGEQIRVDGRLDDAPWAAAPGGTGFRVWEPDRGREPSEQTLFKVARDADALYVAVACFEQDPSRISKRLSRRDRFSNSDLVSIYLDPYHDRTTGYNFRVNPLGVLTDAYIYNDGQRDDDWDAVWQAETWEDGEGWYAEMRIPFSSIRYRTGLTEWGLQVYRYMHGRGEDTAWVVWPRELSGFVSRWGTLRGLGGVPPPRQLEVLPYTVLRGTDPAAAGGGDELDGAANLGADLKYGLTSDLTLNATFQPDFGQVEADPAELNLSPFETFFTEKRPFFIEGNRFFEQPSFTLFYSRRIGTGDENARIRHAAKLTGKTASDLSLAVLAATTDVTGRGQAHNFLKGGDRLSRYFVARFGKELAEGTFRVHVMQTAVQNTAGREAWGDPASREAYTTGLDFDLRLRNREYRMAGSFVGSIVDPEACPGEPRRGEPRYGTGGHLEASRAGGGWRGGLQARWEGDRLDLNDIGYLQSPDEIQGVVWGKYRHTPEGTSQRLNIGEVNLNLWRGWLYGARTGRDLHTGEVVWSYGRGHPNYAGGNVNGWLQWRNYWETWGGIEFNLEGIQRYETRASVRLASGDQAPIPGGGPLMKEPFTVSAWAGFGSDSRRDLKYGLEVSHARDAALNLSHRLSPWVEWNPAGAVSQKVSFNYIHRHDDTQHLGNFENPGGGIGGISYVFGRLRQTTLDLTLRTSLLFGRNQSLEIYAQPFLTVGDCAQAKELARPSTYEFVAYDRDGFRASDRDFRYGAVHMNLVYRWEYRPGSTAYLVWTHRRSDYDQRSAFAARPDRFDNGIGTGGLFGTEPENVLLAKVSYWLPI